MAGVRGIDSKFFASAPTQAMDPNAGIPDPRVMQQLTDTVMQTDRDALASRQFDKNMAFRNREFDERSEQAGRDDARSDQYLGLQRDQFKRTQGNQDYERAGQRRAEIADTTRRWRAAANAGDAGGMKQALEELKRLGVRVEAYGPHAGQPGATPQGQPGPVAPMPNSQGSAIHGLHGSPQSDFSREQGSRTMSPDDRALSAQLSGVEGTMIPQLQGKAPAPPPSPARPGNASDQALAAQMAAIEADMVPKLRGNGFLPGQRPIRPQVAQSDAMLSADDPYNKIK